MANAKITALPADTTPSVDDLVVTVNDPAGTPTNRKVTLGDLAVFMGAQTSYRHVQSAPASTWTVAHNLGYRPNVTAFDSGGTEVEGRVAHASANSLTISFFVGGAPASFSGEAYAS